MLINRKSFGAFLSKKREKAGLSQEHVALKLGYNSGQFVSNWERGASFPPLEKLPELASLLKIPIEEIIRVLTFQTKAFLQTELQSPKKTKLKGVR